MKTGMSKERLGKVILYMVVDIVVIIFSLAIAVSLWYGGTIPGSKTISVPPQAWEWFGYMVLVAPVVCILVFFCFRLYNNLWRYASIDEIFKIFLATILIFVVLYFYDLYSLGNKNLPVLPKRLLFVGWVFEFILFTFSRFGYRAVKRLVIFWGHLMSSKAGCKRVMIVGAGFAGYGVVRGMRNSKIRNKIPVIIVDDDESKANTSILGIRVIFGTKNIEELATKYQIDEIIVAMPSAGNETLKEIIEQCTLTDCTLMIMPPLSDVSDGKTANHTGVLRDINIADLLFREEVKLDTKNISEYLNDRVILVTGGGGSIGSELCRQIAKFGPKLLVIFDIYENNAYMLVDELRSKYNGKLNILMRIGSVRDKKRMEEIFEEFHPNVIFHAAAHKHVPAMEASPAEAVKNNIFGAYNVIQCADKYEAERFVVLSTDKAVNPTNVMGATKRITELILQGMSVRSRTKFMAVRFGNVLGSNGSIIPLWQQQISFGGPVTVTHKDIERYFMTIPEAAQLVLQAAGLGRTGRIFVLDMGSPVKMNDLARNLIKLSGFRPDQDIKIAYTGLRPGEKMYEELIMAEEKEQMQMTHHKKIFVTKPVDLDYEVFDKQLETLYDLAHNHPRQVEPYLREMVPNYQKAVHDQQDKECVE